MKSVFLLLSVFAITIAAEKQTYRVKAISQGSYIIAKDVVLDPAEKTMMVTIGDVSMYPRYITSIDFHDFNTPYVALKIVNEGKCYFVRTEETYPTNDTLTRWQKGIIIEKPLLHTQVKRKITDRNVLQSITGPKIAKFCDNYDTFELQKISGGTKRLATSDQHTDINAFLEQLKHHKHPSTLPSTVVACMAYSVDVLHGLQSANQAAGQAVLQANQH